MEVWFNWVKSCWHTFNWFLILGDLPWTLLHELGITDLGMDALKGPNPFKLPNEALTKYLSASSRPSIKHSKNLPSLELQKTVISPWITLNESNLLHWILNLVNKLCWLTISGSFNLTRILRGPVTCKMGKKLNKKWKLERKIQVEKSENWTNWTKNEKWKIGQCRKEWKKQDWKGFQSISASLNFKLRNNSN